MKARHLIIPAIAVLTACTAEEHTNLEQLGLVRFAVEVHSSNGIGPSAPFALDLQSADGQYQAHWDDIALYNTLDPVYTGPYRATAVSGTPDSEGYDCPCFVGTVDFNVSEGQILDIAIPCALEQALMLVSADDRSSAYTLREVTVHTPGYGYNVARLNDDAPLMVHPGRTTAYVSIADANDVTATVATGFAIDTQSDTPYGLTVNLDADNRLTLACATASTTLDITPALFDGQQPVITTQGFTPDQPMVLTEGYPADQPVVMTVDAPAGIDRMILTVQGSLGGTGLLHQYGLLSESIDSVGLYVTRPDDATAVIDFTRMLEGLTVESNTDLTFTVVAADRLGRISHPCQLRVIINSLEFECIAQTPAMLGTDVATVTLQVNADKFQNDDFSVFQLDKATGAYHRLDILSSDIDPAARTITLAFNIGEGIDPQDVRIDFMDMPKLLLTIERQVPDYAISIDAYATHARVIIDAVTADEQHALTRYARVLIDGQEHTVTYRDTEAGWLAIGGLKPSTRYTVSTQVIGEQSMPHATFTTEADAQIPDGDFEDANPSFAYSGLPSGGVYSNTPFPLYSQQNSVDIDVWWPQKHWANVNAKTFCRSAANHNTWYMQPSAVSDYDVHASGSKSIRLTSVGWSLDGPEIQPYSQAEGQQLPYNANVPVVEHRSAGRLFLGSYSFDPASMTERYTEGVPFTSRPTSLNGFYRFQPDAYDSNDRGIVIVELMGRLNGFEIVVASASMPFDPVSDMMAFNLPLQYHYDGIKAERLRLMFASSSHIGDIATEDAQVAATPDLPNAAFIGSRLWIDNLSFSY